MLRFLVVGCLVGASTCGGARGRETGRLATERLLPSAAEVLDQHRGAVRAELERYASRYLNELRTADEREREARLRTLLDEFRRRTAEDVNAFALGSEGQVLGAAGPHVLPRDARLIDQVGDLHRVLMSGGSATAIVRYRAEDERERLSLVEAVAVSHLGAVVGAFAAVTPLDDLAALAERRVRNVDAAARRAECCLVYADEPYCEAIDDAAWAVVTTRELGTLRGAETVATGDRTAVVAVRDLRGDPPMRLLVYVAAPR